MTLGLGMDAGGTQTRWALARDGEIVAEGEVPGMSALLLASTDGRARLDATMKQIAAAVLAIGRPGHVEAGITGLAEGDVAMCRIIARPFGLEPGAVTIENDIVFAYRGLFEPGEGHVVYAGTGSVAAHIDAQGVLHRAGGRGSILDDGGGGFWIAREALRHIWRNEDARPGAWEESALAREVFARLGGPDWALTRAAVYGGDRGQVGRLALAVAATADTDPVSRSILDNAGVELARLANAMVQRFGLLPVALTGRAARMHPAIGDTMRKALLPGIGMTVRESRAHHAAARLAASAGPSATRARG
ncbi:MAG: BadF/BadG/BcrA/BcrD ATPase family protein [Usitatibacter sp.]